MTVSDRLGNQEGFSLIELFIVVLIIGLLASIAIPTFNGQKAKSNEAVAQSSLRQAFGAARSFYTDKESYSDLNGGAIENASTINAASATLNEYENSVLTTGSGTGQIPGATADPRAIYMRGNTGLRSWITMCNASRGTYTYCIVHDSANNGYTWYGKSTGNILDTFTVTTASSSW